MLDGERDGDRRRAQQRRSDLGRGGAIASAATGRAGLQRGVPGAGHRRALVRLRHARLHVAVPVGEGAATAGGRSCA